MEQQVPNLQDQIRQSLSYKTSDPKRFEDILKSIILYKLNDEQNIEVNLKAKESAYQTLAELYCAQKYQYKNHHNQSVVDKIQTLIVESIESLNDFTKTRAAKIVRQMIDQTASVAGTEETQIKMCLTLIDWCQKEKKTYLRHKIEIRLAALYQIMEKYTKGLDIIDGIIKEVRKADDKHMLLEIYLTESKLHFGLENISKSKASLTAARACANSIYCPPKLQAEIDLMGGILHAQEKDYKTAYILKQIFKKSYSYFYEAFEAFNSLDDSDRALKSFKYMLLTKIMTNNQDDVNGLLASKHGLKYAGKVDLFKYIILKDLEAMKSINENYQRKSLIDFNKVLIDYHNEIRGDNIIKLHIEALYDALLEKNLFSVIQPYSKVQINFVAQRMHLSEQIIQQKLSELILDKKVDGTLDQGNGCLILFDSLKNDNLYKNSLEVIKNMNDVVEKLFDRVKINKN